jgi:putative ABC transport system substrate-binding protein
LDLVRARTSEEIDLAFSAASRAHAQALYMIEDLLFLNSRMLLFASASKTRLPVIYPHRAFVDEGGLMSYGTNIDDCMRRSAAYVDRILKGAHPGDLPIEQPTKVEFVVNLKTAKALRITIPESVLLHADEVIR